MKTIIIIVAFIGSLLSITNSLPSDYRDSACGIYACKKVRWYLNNDGNKMLIDTLFVNLTLSKSEADSIINVITPEGTFVLKLRNSKLTPVDKRGGYYGVLTSDSIYFNLSLGKAPPFYKYYGKK